MKLKKEPTYRDELGLSGHGDFTPYYFNDYFIMNLVTNATGNFAKKDSQNRWQLAQRIKNLRSNNYRFICFYCGRFKDPFEFLDYIQSKGYSLQRHGEFFIKCKTFTDFHGNVVEYSNAFEFRIYDKDMVRRLKEKVAGIKQVIHY